MSPQQILAEITRQKLIKSIDLVQASLSRTEPYNSNRIYTAIELEPYDALCDRFIRCIEMAIKFFKSYERFQFAESSNTIRDLLKRMEKLGIILDTDLWFEMRELRNRIVHDYLPEQLKDMYDLIQCEYAKEIKRLKDVIQRTAIE